MPGGRLVAGRQAASVGSLRRSILLNTSSLLGRRFLNDSLLMHMAASSTPSMLCPLLSRPALLAAAPSLGKARGAAEVPEAENLANADGAGADVGTGIGAGLGRGAQRCAREGGPACFSRAGDASSFCGWSRRSAECNCVLAPPCSLHVDEGGVGGRGTRRPRFDTTG